MVLALEKGSAFIHRWKKCIGLVFLLVTGIILSCFHCTRSACDYDLEDVVQLRAKELALSIIAFHEETGSWPASAYANQQDYAVSAVNEIESYYSGTNVIHVNSPLAFDRWGEPYSLIIRGVEKENDSLLDSINPKACIAVWSSGKNRRNEFGKGDDIVFWWEAEESKSALRRDYSQIKER
jgi:hypothetical protein